MIFFMNKRKKIIFPSSNLRKFSLRNSLFLYQLKWSNNVLGIKASLHFSLLRTGVYWGLNPRPDTCCKASPHSQNYLLLFWDRLCLNCPSWPEIGNLPVSPPQVAGITVGMLRQEYRVKCKGRDCWKKRTAKSVKGRRTFPNYIHYSKQARGEHQLCPGKSDHNCLPKSKGHPHLNTFSYWKICSGDRHNNFRHIFDLVEIDVSSIRDCYIA